VDNASVFNEAGHVDSGAKVPPITEALRFVQMTGIFYCPSVLTEPWGLELPPMPGTVWFHAITNGTCAITVNETVHIAGPGDLVLAPHGTGHTATGQLPAPTPLVFDLPHEHISDQYAILRHGGNGARADLVCGGIRFDHPAAQHLIDALPPVIHMAAAQSNRADWMRATLELMSDETRTARLGNEAIISRLCDIIVIQALRSWIEQDPGATTGWLGALRDDRIGTAIACIHARPELEWTVASLADEVAMSRSAFAARFSEMVGEPVMRYVTRWRMYMALELMKSSDITVAAVAARVGYDSEAAFSRAFSRTIGVTPSVARAKELTLAAPSQQ